MSRLVIACFTESASLAKKDEQRARYGATIKPAR